ncbi:biotin/lipoyl-containing protein [Oceaniglobus roseus]|uniref:biotin/lipoyl-containing protein n=1 Tax=Oceaniglobus roseus TaxID=1737570 RepID=UPI000C7EA730|nr:biotin/lipoyl-containing protein [Kandeliimicrobium roseum]
MPHEVIMPALGMAQDSGVIVSWLKQPGDAVAEGDALFEVETDKATMEVEAQGSGYLTGVTASAGDAVPVGQVIAMITETAEEDSAPSPANGAEAPPDAEPASGDRTMPEGKTIIMPALGMAQDTGLLVSWQKQPGDAVSADDTLFEVETDKAAMEVPAGFDGYVAALLAEPGEEIPVGGSVAIISAKKPGAPFMQSAKAGGAPAAKAPGKAAEAKAPEAKAEASAKPAKEATPAMARSDGRILASPKARRLALERGLDLRRLAEAGHPQPFHVKDLETLAALPAEAPGTETSTAAGTAPAAASRRLCAEVPEAGFTAFCAWAKDKLGITDAASLLAGFAAAGLRTGDSPLTIAVSAFGSTRHYADPDRPWLGRARAEAPEGTPHLLLRDLRHAPLSFVSLGAEDCPVLTLTRHGETLTITLECGAGQLGAEAALTLLTGFAGRMEQPLRHLL